MEEEKLKKVLFAISEKNAKNEHGENIKIVLNSLIGENVKTLNDLWFEAKNIKEDLDYYNIIIALIDILLESLTSQQNVDIETIAEKIVNLLKKSKYCEYYNLTRKIFLTIDQEDKSFYDIYCSVCCLGFKKDSLLNRELIYNLKDLYEYDQFQKSIYCKEIANFNYDNINIEFLNNFNDFIECILNDSSNKKNINEIIKKLTNNSKNNNSKEYTSQSDIVDKNMSLIEIKENDKSLDKKIISSNENIEVEEGSNNEETESTEKEIDKDNYEKFITQYKEINDEGNNISMKTFLLYNKRNHRLNAITLLRTKIKEELKQFELISKTQRELLSYYCSIKENLININRLKALIKKIKDPSIINMKRKLIDLFVFMIIKRKAKFFILNSNYCPNKAYLKKILDVLQIKNKNNNKSKIKEKIEFIEDLIKNNKTTTNYPIKIDNYDLIDILSFFSFYKKKCSNIVHIGKEGLKHYIFPLEKENQFNTGNKPIFSEYEKSNENKELEIKMENDDKFFIDENQEINTLDLDYAFKFIFESMNDYENDETSITKSLESIKEEKQIKIDNIINSILGSFIKITNSFENNSEIPKFDMEKDDDFSKEAKDLIYKCKSEFDSKIKLINELLRTLENTEEKFTIQQDIIASIQEQIISLINKEFYLDNDYYIEIDENKQGKSVLFYFQYKFMKLKDLYLIIQDTCEVYKKYIEKQNLIIKEGLEKVIQESDKINKLIKKDSKIKNGKEIYLNWKKKKHKIMKFETFMSKLHEILKGIKKIKIDDEIIVDEITSCWLVKNHLDDYVLE